MWKHRSYAKAVIRQKVIKLASSEQLIFMLLADHANEVTNSTFFTTSRLCDMTQCSRNTVRKGIKKLEKEKLITCLYTPGKSPTYSVHLPHGFEPGSSDTSFSTVSRAYVPTAAELAAASLEAALERCGISAEQMAKMVFLGIEGLSQEEAQRRAEALFENVSISPGYTIIEQLGIAQNSPVGRSEAEKRLQKQREKEQEEKLLESALDEQHQRWASHAYSGESMEAYKLRIDKGFPGTDEDLLKWRPPAHTALGH